MPRPGLTPRRSLQRRMGAVLLRWISDMPSLCDESLAASVAPTALVILSGLFPALTRWADFCRASGAGVRRGLDVAGCVEARRKGGKGGWHILHTPAAIAGAANRFMDLQL